MVPSNFNMSNKIIPVKGSFSNPAIVLSIRYVRQVLVEQFFQKPDRNL